MTDRVEIVVQASRLPSSEQARRLHLSPQARRLHHKDARGDR